MIDRGELIGRGRTSDVYAVGRTEAVKVPRPGVPAHWAQIEAELTIAVHELGVPTPAVRDLTEIDGRPAIVFERISGESLWTHIQRHPENAAGLARELATIHTRVQAEQAPSNLPDLQARMCTKIDQAHQLDQAERVAATALVRELPSGDALCHGDMHPAPRAAHQPLKGDV
ncbi:MAG: phosphotransferase, partial [Acidimicrobiales bacterium]|nr:phosphotransferase [Acidimicrobiales bacterium]